MVAKLLSHNRFNPMNFNPESANITGLACITLNVVLGIITADYINLVVASATGVLMLAANSWRVVESYYRIKYLRKYGWKPQEEKPLDEPETEEEKIAPL